MRTRPLRAFSSSAKRRGFTAIEIAMVATVIAILALIVIPLFRNRVDEAKIAAAKADLASFMKAEQLAKADTGFYFRLEDLDNIALNDPTPPPGAGVTIETPPMYYPASGNRAQRVNPGSISTELWHKLSGSAQNPSNPAAQREANFKGPYTSMNRTITYGELKRNTDLQPMVRSLNGNQECAIRDLDKANLPAGSNSLLFDSEDNRVPVDPWGNPYLFFPPTGETQFNYASIISLGPDGQPSSIDVNPSVPQVPASYLREGGFLGKGDDLEVRF